MMTKPYSGEDIYSILAYLENEAETPEYAVALREALHAIRLVNVAAKVKRHSYCGQEEYNCPECGQRLRVKRKHPHCPRCGKLLEWEGI